MIIFIFIIILLIIVILLNTKDYKKIKHNETYFTQGLIIYKDHIYESTGLYGYSSLNKYNLNGKLLKRYDKFKNDIFVESITIIPELNKLLVLTWENNKAYEFDEDLNLKKELINFNHKFDRKEAWGVTYYNKTVFITDGSSNIYLLDYVTYKIKQIIDIGIDKLNDLVIVYPNLYINKLYTTNIIKFNLKNNKKNIINISEIIPDINKYNSIENPMNGIGYCYKNKYFIITGKRWPYFYSNINL